MSNSRPASPEPVSEGERDGAAGAAARNGHVRRLEAHKWKMMPWRLLPQDRRITSFDEVIQGFDEASLLAEAERCLLCKYPTCVSGCPNNNPIPTYIAFVQEGKILDAAVADYEKNTLAACTGRVCAWEKQCEGECVLNARGEGVRIGAIERYIADYALAHRAEFEALIAQRAAERAARGRSSYTDPAVSPFAAAVLAYGGDVPPEYSPTFPVPDDRPLHGFRVAVVGAGPAGLSCADFLSRRGCAVTIFEMQKYAGGLLADGIPEFVLPEGVVEAEVARLRDQGVAFTFETALGRDVLLDDLRRAYDAVFLGFGAIKARRSGLPGEDAEGIWTGQEFLQRTTVGLLHQGLVLPPPEVGRRVLIIGAGDTAMDCARTALRLGAKDVRVVYRRTRAESPSRPCEIEHTMTEGATFEYLVNPVEFLKDERGHVRAARMVRMRLGAPDASGRASPEPVPGSEFEEPCDTVILALGYSVGGEVAGHPELLNRNGTIRIRNEGGETDLAGVFAGGDAVRGAFTVVHAIRDGRMAADAIGQYLLEGRAGRAAERNGAVAEPQAQGAAVRDGVPARHGAVTRAGVPAAEVTHKAS